MALQNTIHAETKVAEAVEEPATAVSTSTAFQTTALHFVTIDFSSHCCLFWLVNGNPRPRVPRVESNRYKISL